MNLSQRLGLNPVPPTIPDENLVRYINLKLSTLGLPTFATSGDSEFQQLMSSLLAHQRETERLLADYQCPADGRIQTFLDDYLADVGGAARLPVSTFVLDRHGLARALSLPPDRDEHKSQWLTSTRVHQGVLHNPASDRRTTKGSFHVAEGGSPIPADKLAVPKNVFSRMLEKALDPPDSLMQVPFTASQESQARCFVSLLIRPLVCPAVPGYIEEKSMEIRFFVPGSLVSNLDFVESIFGNAGNPFLPENDAGLDVEHWTGHSGCVILAPHLVSVKKKDVGLPHWDDATPRQREEGMCWKDEQECYNGGTAFKLTARDERGVVVTLIADNYFGYCKKEVKTQIGYSANLYGLCEEEHAGGTIVYPAYDLGEEFSGFLHVKRMGHSFEEVKEAYGSVMNLQPEGYGIDKTYPGIYYVPEDAHFYLHEQKISWTRDGQTKSIKLLPGRTYIRPSGYKVHMEKTVDGRGWRLVGTTAEGLVCHKPCTVSGGGKSEISKPITDAIFRGPIFLADFQKDFARVRELLQHDYSQRFLKTDPPRIDHRSVLSPERSLGSVIKLLTPARRDYTQEYNDWLNEIPQYLKELVYVVKRYHQPEWEDQWQDHFSVDIVDGRQGYELKFDNRRLMTQYLRVGYEQNGSWRTFSLRQDFHPGSKLSLEDDITASVVVPRSTLDNLSILIDNPSVKFVQNCEYRFFQRPDDAIHPGYDKLTELDYSKEGNFLSNYEPLSVSRARELIEDSIGFEKFTKPMQDFIRKVSQSRRPAFFVANTHPRIVDGKPTKNPRYLQLRPDLVNQEAVYLANMATRMHRRLPLGEPLHTPVQAVVPGRRNNPPDPAAGIRPLCVYNPIHYMELPELFMEFICSMTGKSPSTTGAGSEGALTKGPFNALPTIIDLNNALVSYLLTDYHGFVTAAGFVGPKSRVDHDVSLLIPEVLCRMTAEERQPDYLIQNGFLEKCVDLEHEGTKVLSSRLGYRITKAFVRTFFGRMFNHPLMVLTEEMLQPELQDKGIFAEGMDNILQTQKRVANLYFQDGTIELACPPLRALLHIMAHGQYEGQTLDDPTFRALFTRENLLESDWYAARLQAKQNLDEALWQRHIQYLEEFMRRPGYEDVTQRLELNKRLKSARLRLDQVRSDDYRKQLQGTLGAQPLTRSSSPENGAASDQASSGKKPRQTPAMAASQ